MSFSRTTRPILLPVGIVALPWLAFLHGAVRAGEADLPAAKPVPAVQVLPFPYH